MKREEKNSQAVITGFQTTGKESKREKSKIVDENFNDQKICWLEYQRTQEKKGFLFQKKEQEEKK